MANRLASALSPYLLQHQDNPVHWWEWSPEAFAAAAQRDVPILLSVGYASCHWCHVMAHESFEDQATADLMNRWFVNIKVDREERPDVDRIYMDTVQAMTGRGGWPMTVFLTPEGKPFFAGTYFPQIDRGGHPSFTRVLEAVNDAWSNRRGEIEGQSERLAAAVAATPTPGEGPTPQDFVAAYEGASAAFDAVWGGFGGAPKFPQAPVLEFLLRASGAEWAPQAGHIVAASLRGMAAGGIRDRVGGGFARYSVDERWLIPHFEKMLYDNALLARLFAQASQALDTPAFAATARETVDYMLSDLRLPDGGFASAEDADSEGEEGAFYVFTSVEVEAAAGEHAETVMAALGVTEGGNFEGRNVLHDALTPEEAAGTGDLDASEVSSAVAHTLRRLREIRDRRTRPLRDDKVVAAWNGLAVRALADTGTILGAPEYVAAAEAAATFVLDQMTDAGGRLARTWRDGRVGPPAFCDDYGALALGCFSLYRATGDANWYHRGAGLTEDMVELFRDPADGGFFAAGHDAERLIARPKNLFDNPTPSDNALAAEAMLHMAAFTGESRWWDRIEAVARLGSRLANAYPLGAGHLLSVALTASAPPLEVALVGEGLGEMTEAVLEEYRPTVFLARNGGGVPLLEDRPALEGAATAYVCRGFVCDRPTTSVEGLRAALEPR